MFVGHALLAFALAAVIAQWRGWPARQAFALAIAAGAFAALPDVDVLYAAVAMNPTDLVAGTAVRPGAFWSSASDAHRLMTHSLVVAAVAGPAFGLWALGTSATSERVPRDWRRVGAIAVALVALGILVAVAAKASGPIGAFVMVAFVLVGLAIAGLSRWYLGLSPGIVAVAAVAGLASHPWGDLVTGEPPALFYPLEVGLLTERVVLSGDPTLHLLGAFAIELAVVAFTAVVVAGHAGFSPRRLVDRRAAFGALYGVGAVVMAPPTIHLSYQFVFSILAVGAICGTAGRPRFGRHSLRNAADRVAGDAETALRTAFTTLAGIAVALVSYGTVYLLVG